MAKRNRPAHGGVSYHRCQGAFLIGLHDSNGAMFAHYASDNRESIRALAQAILADLAVDDAIPVTHGTA